MVAVGSQGSVIPAGTPTSGAWGQVLKKNSASNFDTTWVSTVPAAAMSTLTAGSWYPNLMVGNTTASWTNFANDCFYMPIWLPHPIGVVSLRSVVYSLNAGATFQFGAATGAYNSSGIFVPYAVIGEASTAAVTTSSASYTVDFSASPLALPGGWSFLFIDGNSSQLYGYGVSTNYGHRSLPGPASPTIAGPGLSTTSYALWQETSHITGKVGSNLTRTPSVVSDKWGILMWYKVA